jgi:putative ABC transport system permease protein
VTFQFVVSIGLIICTLVVFRQMRFMQSKDLGFDQSHTFMIRNTHLLGKAERAFQQELAALSTVEKASIATGAPSKENFGDTYLPELSSAGEKLVPDISLSSFIVDADFIPTLGIKLLQGRNFSKDFFDSTSVILNEEAVRAIGWKDPVGSYMSYPGNNNQRFKVIGVVKNFNINSLHTPVQPFALFHTSSKTYNINLSYILVRNKPGDPSVLLGQIKEKWKLFAPATPFEVSFLDSEFNALYRAEQRLGKVFFIFTSLSIFVACLGLFGLVVYTAESRRKEIGIRKVLGAQVHTIMRLLSVDFIKPVALATLIAIPVAWWAMNKWLQDFAYRTKMEWWIMGLSVAVALLLTLITVSWQTFRAAIQNPVKNLRSE